MDARQASQTGGGRHKWCYALYHDAIKTGRLVRPDRCSICGVAGRIAGHHEDYTTPLDVVWCCPFCHGSIHGCGIDETRRRLDISRARREALERHAKLELSKIALDIDHLTTSQLKTVFEVRDPMLYLKR